MPVAGLRAHAQRSAQQTGVSVAPTPALRGRPCRLLLQVGTVRGGWLIAGQQLRAAGTLEPGSI